MTRSHLHQENQNLLICDLWHLEAILSKNK
jgi:hypothetical protein